MLLLKISVTEASVRMLVPRQDGYQHGVSIQISINLGKTFLQISRIRNIPLT